MTTPHVPYLPPTAKTVYRVLLSPVLTPRKCGGWRAKGEVFLRTEDSTEARRTCDLIKNSCVVQNHGIMLAQNNVKGVRKRCAPKGWGFVFGRALKH